MAGWVTGYASEFEQQATQDFISMVEDGFTYIDLDPQSGTSADYALTNVERLQFSDATYIEPKARVY